MWRKKKLNSDAAVLAIKLFKGYYTIQLGRRGSMNKAAGYTYYVTPLFQLKYTTSRI